MISDMMPGDATKMLLVTTLNFVLICSDLGKLSATASWCYLVSFGGPMQPSAERRNGKHLKSQKTQHVDVKRNEQNVKSRSKPKVAWTEPIPLNPRHSGTRGYFNWLHLLSVCSTGLFHQEQSQNSQRPVDMCQTSVERRTRIFTHTHTRMFICLQTCFRMTGDAQDFAWIIGSFPPKTHHKKFAVSYMLHTWLYTWSTPYMIATCGESKIWVMSLKQCSKCSI